MYYINNVVYQGLIYYGKFDQVLYDDVNVFKMMGIMKWKMVQGLGWVWDMF